MDEYMFNQKIDVMSENINRTIDESTDEKNFNNDQYFSDEELIDISEQLDLIDKQNLSHSYCDDFVFNDDDSENDEDESEEEYENEEDEDDCEFESEDIYEFLPSSFNEPIYRRNNIKNDGISLYKAIFLILVLKSYCNLSKNQVCLFY